MLVDDAFITFDHLNRRPDWWFGLSSRLDLSRHHLVGQLNRRHLSRHHLAGHLVGFGSGDALRLLDGHVLELPRRLGRLFQVLLGKLLGSLGHVALALFQHLPAKLSIVEASFLQHRELLDPVALLVTGPGLLELVAHIHEAVAVILVLRDDVSVGVRVDRSVRFRDHHFVVVLHEDGAAQPLAKLVALGTSEAPKGLVEPRLSRCRDLHGEIRLFPWRERVDLHRVRVLRAQTVRGLAAHVDQLDGTWRPRP
mmetsp:Transcript_219/g.376  ORF Transcript_219/g.376 Transcript_219/m.376 type:complete len:253 (-) Transcript_219:190-948(-)